MSLRSEALTAVAIATDNAFGELLERIYERDPDFRAAILVGAINALTRFTVQHAMSSEEQATQMGVMSIWSPIIGEAIVNTRIRRGL